MNFLLLFPESARASLVQLLSCWKRGNRLPVILLISFFLSEGGERERTRQGKKKDKRYLSRRFVYRVSAGAGK